MIEIGLKHTSELTVTDTVTAIKMGSGDMLVLATPAMMALMENAAMLAVADELPEGCTTVGGHIESSHLKPSKIGDKVSATAEVTNTIWRNKMSKRDYIQANKDWLEAKAKEEDVKALPKGIYYKVLSEDNQESAKPTVRSIITAHYTGRTIDGKQFDSSRGGVPLACRLCDLIEGWIIAIQQMHIGDKWEIYIPAEMGYGKFSQPGIPGGSTLIFEIELLGIA